MRHMTKRWGLRPAQKVNLVKTFVYPIIDYVTFLQPLSPKVRFKESHVNIRVAEWALEVTVSQSKASKAIAMVSLNPLEMRRAKAARGMAMKTINDSQESHLKRCATILGAYGTLKRVFQEAQQQKEKLDVWVRDQELDEEKR